MKFFFPDSQDTVSPDFNFDTERHSSTRVRHRDDIYAHELFGSLPFDGLLVSKAIVDGVEGSGKYTFPQRIRIRREGVRDFFRLNELPFHVPVIGDCGAFSYVKHPTPPPEFSVDNVLEFYQECGFDFGVSVDHVILAYQQKWDEDPNAIPTELRDRQALTLELASEFIHKQQAERMAFEPMGVAQGWSPRSYAHAVQELRKMGYSYIALGGMVPLKTHEILQCLQAIDIKPSDNIRMHLLGVTRTDHVTEFARYGVASFDSTSPFLQAFKDERDNYYTLDRTYSAVRIPQVEGNPGLLRKIKAGIVSQEQARRLEKACLQAMKDFDQDRCSVEHVVDILAEYEQLYDPKRMSKHLDAYRQVLQDKPWRTCPCEVCSSLGYQVVLFRGSERNKRRGFHNLWVFWRILQQRLGRPIPDHNNLQIASIY